MISHSVRKNDKTFANHQASLSCWGSFEHQDKIFWYDPLSRLRAPFKCHDRRMLVCNHYARAIISNHFLKMCLLIPESLLNHLLLSGAFSVRKIVLGCLITLRNFWGLHYFTLRYFTVRNVPLKKYGKLFLHNSCSFQLGLHRNCVNKLVSHSTTWP